MSDELADAAGEDEADGEGAEDPAVAGARRRGKGAALVVVIVVSLLFIISSCIQIIPAVFGLGFDPLPSAAAPGSAEHQCAAGIRGLARALDRAGVRLASVASAADDITTMAALRPSLAPEWDAADLVRAACDRATDGPSAWAALQRLRMAVEQSGRLDEEDLTAVRGDVAAHLPTDLR